MLVAIPSASFWMHYSMDHKYCSNLYYLDNNSCTLNQYSYLSCDYLTSKIQHKLVDTEGLKIKIAIIFNVHVQSYILEYPVKIIS